jgi:uncharacterized membrane protein YdbT with pleckstrin-like domain
MTFPERFLTDDEKIVRQFRPHWRLLFIPMAWVVAGIVAIVLVYQVIPPSNGKADLITSLVVVAALVPLSVWPIVTWWFTHYILTTERLITRSGVIARNGIEIPLVSVNNVIFSQNALERMLRSGDLLIESAGRDGQSRFSDIPDPEEFQALLYKTRDDQSKARYRDEGAAIAEANADPSTRLERLTQLHRDGVINDEEFEEKRRGLIDEL